MIGTIVKTEEYLSSVKKIDLLCTSNALGQIETDEIPDVRGTLYRVDVWPSVAVAPTNNFDIRVYDASQASTFGSLDLLASAGENISNVQPTRITPTNAPLVGGAIKIRGVHLGDSKQAHIILYLE